MPSTTIQFFKFEHLRDGELKEVSKLFAEFANLLEQRIPDSAEKSAGMRKLLEAKDCMCRATLPVEK